MLEQEKSERMELIWHFMAKVYCDKGDLDKSLVCSQRASSIWDSDVEHIGKAPTIEYIAKAYERKNRTDYYDQILCYYTQALAMYQRLLPMENENITKCLECIAHFYDISWKFDLGIDSYKRAASSSLSIR
jgi:tetratricopeptide (TPR) repeat protein